MSAGALRLFAIILIVLAVLLGGFAYLMSRGSNQHAANSEQTTYSEADHRVQAVVATTTLQPYQAVTADEVTLVPVSVAPKQYFKNVQEVIGRKPLRVVEQGTTLSSAIFGTPSSLSRAIPPGTEAMSLSVSDVVAVGGFVKPGDFVDVLVYIRSAGDEVGDTQARILLRDARLLAYDQQLINSEKNSEDANRSNRASTAVIAVPETLMTRVMLGASIGELRLALRRSAESEQKSSVVAMDGTDNSTATSNATSFPTAHSVAAESMSEAERREVGGVDQVITLKELAALKAEQNNQVAPKPKAATRPSHRSTPTVEIYEGVDSHRVSRPQ